MRSAVSDFSLIRDKKSSMTLENNDIQNNLQLFNKIFAHHVKFMRQNYGLKVTPATTNNSKEREHALQLP